MAYIRELESGKWQAVVRRSGNKPTSKSFDTKTQAGQWARMIESEIDRGVFVDRTESERATVGELIDRYLAEVTPKKKSARPEKRRLNALKTHFGAFALASLPPISPPTVSERRVLSQRLALGLPGSEGL